eukprot:TRINITY_DN72252_c0_g1_i1.p1 TRINITY_DN72252_c0_g1~~TRINITY_DN72252_c0_g1_i1.p1  ORF type:complete len:374 (+),score=53.42 TRINITY_DN72252_c0_g1_i1:53-1123(+)
MLRRALVPSCKVVFPLQRHPPVDGWVRACASKVGKVLEPLHEHHFRIVEVDGRGLGAIATKDFSPGELVLAERPIIGVRTNEGGDAWEAELYREYDKLTVEEQAEVWKLHDVCVQKPEKSLEGIFFTNCISRGTGYRWDMGLMLKLSRFNHSCCPNLEQSWDEDAGQAHLVAAEPIKAGEELFTHYVELRLPREERRKQLHENYRFWCDCAKACALPEDVESDNRRTEMKRLDQEILKTGPKNPERGLQMVRKLLKLYDQEGLHMSSWRKRNCLSAMEFSLARSDLPSAMRWARKGYDFARLAHGSQHRDTKWLLQLSKDPSSHPAFEYRHEGIRNTAMYVMGITILIGVWLYASE